MSILDREMLALMRQVTDAIILPRYRNLAAGEIEEKQPGDLVTIADREAEAMLFEGLAKLDPGIALVGEEAVHADPALADRLAGSCWIVDPVDGTRNFARGQAPFGIIIARAEGGEAQSGWIFDCLTGRFCAAHRGSGAFIGGERIEARASGEAPPVAAISLLFADQAQQAALTDYVLPHYRLADIPFCAAEQYPRLANGTNDVSLFTRTLAWDHAAGALWLNEAGGCAARPDGSPYRVDRPARTSLIAAASPTLFEGLAGRLAASAALFPTGA